jgi:ribose 5-phosphate isomerase B
MKKIAIASDHAGFELKESLKAHLKESGYAVTDFGAYNLQSVDYPDHVRPVAEGIQKGDFELGVLVCGSGEGVCMSANKYKGIRAGLAWNEEIARLIRAHNHANVICFGGRFTAAHYAIQMLDAFLHSAPEGGNHERRVAKLELN